MYSLKALFINKYLINQKMLLFVIYIHDKLVFQPCKSARKKLWWRLLNGRQLFW